MGSMKLPQFTLRDLFWLLLVAAMASFGIARELTRDRHVQMMQRKLEYPPDLYYMEPPSPMDYSLQEHLLSKGRLREGESVEVHCHHDYFDYTVRLKSRGEVVERRFSFQPSGGCYIRLLRASSKSP
jgi:hypothetical protein